MAREWTTAQLAERSISKKYRKEIWNPFIAAVKRYALIQAGDKIAVCISGGGASMLLAKALQLLQRFSETPFSLIFLLMDPGRSPADRRLAEENADALGIPLTVIEIDVSDTAEPTEEGPCSPCAPVLREQAYRRARALGCNKIALGHHFTDVIETALGSMLYSAKLQGMMPKVRSGDCPGVEWIRPLFCVREEDILAWQRYNQLSFPQRACPLPGTTAQPDAMREEIKALIRDMKKRHPDVEQCIFSSLHSVCLDTFPEYSHHGVKHSFLEAYDD